MKNSWFNIEKTYLIDSPALVIYPDRVKVNIRLLKTMIDDPQRLRPHVKTHKTIEATLLLMEAGIQKFKCATIAEAEMLGICMAKDVLLAYQPNGPKLKRFVAVIKKYSATLFSCLADNIESAKQISEAALSNAIVIPVYIDLNVGMNRTGIQPGKEAIQLYDYCSTLDGIQLMGFHAYDGHIHEKDMQKRIALCNEVFVPVEETILALTKKGYEKPRLIAGGSPTFPIHAKRKDAECSPGTFIYWDKGYQDTLPEQQFLPAALVITRIISLPGETTLCLDLGHKSVAAENDLSHRIYFLNAPELKMISQSEEHLVVETSKGHSWKIGDLLYGLPIHICPTCALYESANIIENGIIAGTWKMIARDRKINI